jgi:uncharacterized membrane protein YbhN (UPF0104 family)
MIIGSAAVVFGGIVLYAVMGEYYFLYYFSKLLPWQNILSMMQHAETRAPMVMILIVLIAALFYTQFKITREGKESKRVWKLRRRKSPDALVGKGSTLLAGIASGLAVVLTLTSASDNYYYLIQVAQAPYTYLSSAFLLLAVSLGIASEFRKDQSFRTT